MASNNVQNVKIVAAPANKYATIVRACLTAAKAAKDLNHFDEAEQFAELEKWASAKWQYAIKA